MDRLQASFIADGYVSMQSLLDIESTEDDKKRYHSCMMNVRLFVEFSNRLDAAANVGFHYFAIEGAKAFFLSSTINSPVKNGYLYAISEQRLSIDEIIVLDHEKTSTEIDAFGKASVKYFEDRKATETTTVPKELEKKKGQQKSILSFFENKK